MCRAESGYLQNDASSSVFFVFSPVLPPRRSVVIGLLVVDVVVVVVRKIGVVSTEHLPAEINEDLVDVG